MIDRKEVTFPLDEPGVVLTGLDNPDQPEWLPDEPTPPPPSLESRVSPLGIRWVVDTADIPAEDTEPL